MGNWWPSQVSVRTSGSGTPRPAGSSSRSRRSPGGDVAFRPDGQTLAVADGDDRVRFYKIDGTQVPEPWINRAINGMTFSPDGSRLLTQDSTGRVRLWHLTSQ
ncbi:WD40 repeat domain-containing protein [Micromonospora sp. NPDC049171]|uniref:WD40 repeat domain-containing protein n=1 Tax=Micromonospora sp. NPDC049171 TaxID=3155770 RepID=UPI0033E4C041